MLTEKHQDYMQEHSPYAYGNTSVCKSVKRKTNPDEVTATDSTYSLKKLSQQNVFYFERSDIYTDAPLAIRRTAQ